MSREVKEPLEPTLPARFIPETRIRTQFYPVARTAPLAKKGALAGKLGELDLAQRAQKSGGDTPWKPRKPWKNRSPEKVPQIKFKFVCPRTPRVTLKRGILNPNGPKGFGKPWVLKGSLNLGKRPVTRVRKGLKNFLPD